LIVELKYCLTLQISLIIGSHLIVPF
jgi:hypothetical protein